MIRKSGNRFSEKIMLKQRGERMIRKKYALGLMLKSAPDDRSGSTDQSRQLLEAAADAIGDEVDHLVLEHQHQLAILTTKMGRGQHPGPRRRDQMRDAERRAEHA